MERKTRFLIVHKVANKSAAATIAAQLSIFATLPAAARLSVTCDNGTEFARHFELIDILGMDTWFADPYSSYQRGSNENRNGQLRRYLPKSTNLDDLDEHELQAIVDTINNTPLKVLDWRTPAQAWQEETNNLLQSNQQPLLHL